MCGVICDVICDVICGVICDVICDVIYEPESIETTVTLWHLFSECFLVQSVGMVLKSTY